MRRIVLWLASTVTIVVLLFGYHTSTNKTASTTAPGGAGPAPNSSPSASGGTGTSTYAGSVASTRWGPVQVQISVESGVITEVKVLQQPDGNHRDVEINEQALPVLIKETIDEQSADIDMVSGATVTSEGYLESLQAALDKAGI